MQHWETDRLHNLYYIMAASFLGNLMKGGGDATALRKKKFTEGTLRYNLYRQAQETLRAGVSLKQARIDGTVRGKA